MRRNMARHRAPKSGVRQRWHFRRTLAARVALELEDKVGVEARIYGIARNLGLGGIRVQLPINPFYPNARATVSFLDKLPKTPLRLLFPATVMWSSGNGAGLMFDDFDRRTLQSLWNIMLQYRCQRKRGRPRMTRR